MLRMLFCAAAIVLPSCENTTSTALSGTFTSDSLDPRAQYTSVSASDAWINVPRSALVVERQLRGKRAQRILLPNHTYLTGDNVIYLRAVRNRSSGTLGAFDLEPLLRFIGGVPRPFTRQELSLMKTRPDAAGTLTWAVWTDGAGTPNFFGCRPWCKSFSDRLCV